MGINTLPIKLMTKLITETTNMKLCPIVLHVYGSYLFQYKNMFFDRNEVLSFVFC
jgi:hypothetical protein